MDSNQLRKTKVVLGQLGSPKTPAVKDVRAYLKEFLGDPRVVDINPTVWKIILNLFVLPFRPKKSAQAYARIWNGKSFPLIDNTINFANKIQKELEGTSIEINHAFLLSSPRIPEVLEEWIKDGDEKAESCWVMPQFPQYSESTIGSVVDVLGAALGDQVELPELHFVTHYHKTKAFIDNSVRIVENRLRQIEAENKDLVISFHGLPTRRVVYKNDPYYMHCWETFKLITDKIDPALGFSYHFTFQSRFGSEPWLGPATDEYVIDLVKDGKKDVAVYCPSFVVDCLETTDEIGNELGEEMEEIGGNLHFIECLNDDEQWVKDYAHYIKVQVEGSAKEKADLEYKVDKKEMKMSIPEQDKPTPPLSKHASSTLKIVFLTLFLDLVGFSIIFPMFPALAKHYLTVDSDNYFLRLIFDSIVNFMSIGGGGDNGVAPIVLFGGALGALYSFLQFLCAPFWGLLSDKIGRKPVLLISVFGLFLSYVLWFFAGSFTTLIIARTVGGLMAGNISTASAVVADVTQKENRSRGMAFVGIAFALGFIIGPAMGGIMTMWNMENTFPQLVSWGLNPFSSAALLAGSLSLLNLYMISKRFKETLPENNRNKTSRTANVLKLFKPLPYKGFNKTNIGHFLFLTAFSGMEFTITFLAVERLGYTSMDNAYMFIFIGFTLAMVQGGYVRRKAHSVGEQKMALQGMVTIIPGLILLALAHSSFMLYAGLFFLAIGSAMIIPCLTSLISLYTPSDIQGQALGIFRSLGALARVIGPLMACMIYWKLGSASPYFAGAVFLLIPIFLIYTLPKLKKT